MRQAQCRSEISQTLCHKVEIPACAGMTRCKYGFALRVEAECNDPLIIGALRLAE